MNLAALVRETVVDARITTPPEQDLPHLFERFWRAGKVSPRQAGGSGLGLAIVSALVKAHHGAW